jgi:TusA-related sulfurtransferase
MLPVSSSSSEGEAIMVPAEVQDFTDLTCTNLMIRMKILLNKLDSGDSITFYATREQVDNTCSLFSANGYRVSWAEKSQDRYLVTLGK